MKISTSGKSALTQVCNWLLAFMWTYAAFSKLYDYNNFRLELQGHKLISGYAQAIAMGVPLIELVIAVLILFRQIPDAGLYSSMALLGIFTIYIVYMFIFYPHTPCSCGGIISALSWKEHIVFNLLFMTMALPGLSIIKSTRHRETN